VEARPGGADARLVLCYHAVSATWPWRYAVAPGALEAQVRSLLEREFRPVTFAELVAGSPDERLLAITFDDGYRSVAERALPLLDRLAAPATAFVCPGLVEERALRLSRTDWIAAGAAAEIEPMGWAELRRLRDAGWEIGSHTRTHPRLTELGDAALAAELAGSSADIERELGAPCPSLAYPFGDHDDRVVAAAAAAGYSQAAIAGSARRRRPPERLRWPRLVVTRGRDPARLCGGR